MLPTTFTRGIDRALHAQRLGGPYQRRLDRHALGPPVHGQHGRREPRVDAVGAAQQERAAAGAHEGADLDARGSLLDAAAAAAAARAPGGRGTDLVRARSLLEAPSAHSLSLRLEQLHQVSSDLLVIECRGGSVIRMVL